MKKIALALIACMVSSSVHADPVKFLRSQVGPDFAAEVASYAEDFSSWKRHMASVEDDKKAGLAKEKAHAPFPGPTAAPAVMSAIDANGNPNYQIIEDGPTPEQVLAAKKAKLLSTVDAAAAAALAVVSPVGKRASFAIRENDIRIADRERLTVVEKALGRATGDYEQMLESRRPPADTQFIRDQADRAAKIDAILRAGARAQSDVEDLTADNIDAWKMPDFPK